MGTVEWLVTKKYKRAGGTHQGNLSECIEGVGMSKLSCVMQEVYDFYCASFMLLVSPPPVSKLAPEVVSGNTR